MFETTELTYCILCGKEITEGLDHNNPDPLVAPDENGFIGDCCGECNLRYVRPARSILWATDPNLSARDRKECPTLIPYVQKMPLGTLRNALDSEDPLAAFRTFRKKCQRQERWSWLKYVFK